MKWDYLLLEVLAYAPCVQAMKDLGNEGWELVSTVIRKDRTILHYFKRPIT